MFTLRELVTMAESKSREQWSHTSHVLALVANVHRDAKKTRAFKPGDFNPHGGRRVNEGLPKVEITALKALVPKD